MQIRSINSYTNQKTVFGENNTVASKNTAINVPKEDDKYVKITKTQDKLNTLAWVILIVSAIYGTIKAISDFNNIPKI